LFDQRDRRHATLVEKLDQAVQPIGLPIPVVDEVLKGLLALVHREREPARRQPHYRRLASLLTATSTLDILELTDLAIQTTDRFRHLRTKVGVYDVMIASIAISTDSLLLSANVGDYSQFHDLHVENWLE
jgi:predicted nucleic acid-binding protein